jgi:hypothetical protein
MYLPHSVIERKSIGFDTALDSVQNQAELKR